MFVWGCLSGLSNMMSDGEFLENELRITKLRCTRGHLRKVRFDYSQPAHVHTKSVYMVSWHLCSWVHFLARCEIHSNKYISLQFPKETNTRGSNSDAFYSFSHKCTEFRLKKHNLRTIAWRISCYDFKTIWICWEIWKPMLLNVSITHIQVHIDGFLLMVNLFCSSRSTQTYLRSEELRLESHVTTVQQNSSNLHKEVQIAWLHQQVQFYISFAFVNTIG